MHYRLSREKLEEYATKVLKQYKPKCLSVPQAVDVHDFMENFMKLNIDYKNLSCDNSILGLTSFNNGIFYVWDDGRETQYPIEVQKGTVILENSLLDSQHDGRERFTVMHECSHQLLHKKIYESVPDISKDGLLACAKRDIDPGKKRLNTSKDWIEWQANTLAASILTPRDMVKEAFLDV